MIMSAFRALLPLLLVHSVAAMQPPVSQVSHGRGHSRTAVATSVPRDKGDNTIPIRSYNPVRTATNSSFGHDLLPLFLMKVFPSPPTSRTLSSPLDLRACRLSAPAHTCLGFLHHLKPGYVNMNNGAFGTGCKAAYELLHTLNMEMEADCNDWFRGGYQPKLVAIRDRLAGLVNCDSKDLVIVDNASAGANAVLRSYADSGKLVKGDGVLHWNIVYPMVKNVIQYIAREKGLQVVTANISFPVTKPQEIIDTLKTAIASVPAGTIKVAALDWMASYPAVLLPIKEIIQVCHDHNIFVFVDAAHCFGQINMDLRDIGADALVSNLHKWSYAAKVAAILYVAPKWQSIIFPTVISGELDSGYITQFQYTGTRNYNPFLAAQASLDMMDKLGRQNIIDYMHQLTWTAANELAKMWGTSVMVQDESMTGALIPIVTPTSNGTLVGQVRAALLKEYDTYIQTGPWEPTGEWYVRISGQIYLELEDFLTMGKRFLELMNKFK